MDDDLEPKNPTSISSWIVSLAVSVTCCAVLFVIFAENLTEIKKNISTENNRLEEVAQHQEQLIAEVRAFHHSAMGQGGSTAASPTATTAPPSSSPTLAPIQQPDTSPANVPAASPQSPVPPTPATSPAAEIPEQVSPQPVTPSPAPNAEPNMPPVSVPSLPPAKQ